VNASSANRSSKVLKGEFNNVQRFSMNINLLKLTGLLSNRRSIVQSRNRIHGQL
jgi:hypothetical protein